MTKQEFLNGLRAALTGRVNASMVAENLSYYEDYINTKVRMGRREEEVVGELGDPRLLARSIAEANKHAGMSEGQEGYRESGAEGAGFGEESSYHGRSFRMPGWLIAFLIIFVILFILSLTVSVLSFLAPILFPLLLIVMIVKLFRRM